MAYVQREQAALPAPEPGSVSSVRTRHEQSGDLPACLPQIRTGDQAVAGHARQVPRSHSSREAAATASSAWQRTFPAEPQHVRDARSFLSGLLDGHPAAGDAATCLSELAANAVLHSDSARPGGTFRVRAALHRDTLRVEVEDDGGSWNPDTGPADYNGRGLVLVSALTGQWGITQDDHGNRTVWFEMP